MIPGLYFTYGVFVAFTTMNALRRPSSPRSRFPTIWVLGMLDGELPALAVVSRAFVSAGAGALGAFDDPVGRTGLWLVAASILGIPVLAARTYRAGRALAALVDTDPPRPNGWTGALGWSRRLPRDLEVVGPFQVADDVSIHFYRRRVAHHAPAPVLLYVHGGSWTGGDPHTQSRPLLHHLAARGWLVATTTYPLSPDATFPDHLIGVKRAIDWLRRNVADHGADPQRIAIAGASAGGHLAALAALTAHRSNYQPGFEDADTSVAACVSLYGIYDFLNRHHTRRNWPLIPRVVMKADPRLDRERFHAASPIDQVAPDAVPFLVIHGRHDSLVPPAEARVFVEALRAVSENEVQYVEIEGAQHAFDAVESRRSRLAAAVAAEFLESHLAVPAPDGPVRRY